MNIVLYNVFGGGGPELYGTEPLSFYMLNLLLNWNIAYPLALLAVPTSALLFSLSCPAGDWRRWQPVAFANLGLLAWLAVFFKQAHKEERFLFPVYPLIALSAAVAADALHKLAGRLFPPGSRLSWLPTGGLLSVLAVFGLLSGARAVSQYRNFHAPFDVYMHLGESLSRLPPPPQGPASVQVPIPPPFVPRPPSGTRDWLLRCAWGRSGTAFPAPSSCPPTRDSWAASRPTSPPGTPPWGFPLHPRPLIPQFDPWRRGRTAPRSAWASSGPSLKASCPASSQRCQFTLPLPRVEWKSKCRTWGCRRPPASSPRTRMRTTGRSRVTTRTWPLATSSSTSKYWLSFQDQDRWIV